MPSMFGKDSKKKELIKNLDSLYAQVIFLTMISYSYYYYLKSNKFQIMSITKMYFIPKVTTWTSNFPRRLSRHKKNERAASSSRFYEIQTVGYEVTSKGKKCHLYPFKTAISSVILQTAYKRTNEFVNLNRLTKCWQKTFQNLCSWFHKRN